MSIRNYNAFLKAVRKKHGITQKQAQRAYRRVAERLGRSPRGIDVKRHPRITSDAVRPRKRVTKPVTPRKKPAPGKPIRNVKSISEWRRLYREDRGFDIETIVSSADYGTGRKRK